MKELCEKVEDGWRKRLTSLVRGTNPSVLILERKDGNSVWINLPFVSGLRTCKPIKVTVYLGVKVYLPFEGAECGPQP